MASSIGRIKETLSEILIDSLQKNDNPLLFVADVLIYLQEERQALPAGVVVDLLLEQMFSDGAHWRAALDYLKHALAAGLAPVQCTVSALLTRYGARLGVQPCAIN
jgi:hypothetical protein